MGGLGCMYVVVASSILWLSVTSRLLPNLHCLSCEPAGAQLTRFELVQLRRAVLTLLDRSLLLSEGQGIKMHDVVRDFALSLRCECIFGGMLHNYSYRATGMPYYHWVAKSNYD